MSCDAVLGKPLHEAVVTDSTILGGQVMRAYEARYDHLGSGELPWTEHGAIVDTLDVADLESEAEHRYELLGARDGEQIAEEGNAPDGRVVVDGGRTHRVRERFVGEAAARSRRHRARPGAHDRRGGANLDLRSRRARGRQGHGGVRTVDGDRVHDPRRCR